MEYRTRVVFYPNDKDKPEWSSWRPLPEYLDILRDIGYIQLEFRAA
jgi:hypothetical protein